MTSDSSPTSYRYTSPDSSFKSHVTSQCHPSLCDMACSDFSRCDCSNTLNIQSYADSVAQHIDNTSSLYPSC